MSILQKMHFESGLLKVDARGEFSLEEAKRAFLEMLEAVAQYQAEKVLFDARNMKGKPERIERFYYGYFAATETNRLIAKHQMPRAPRFAYVLNEPLRDPGKYGETVAVNRGMNVKSFETLEEAFKWLGLTLPNKPDAGDA
jgi:SpoIIAA-like